MRILFIGGTGRLSKDVAKLALDCGNEVFLFTRGSENRSAFVEPTFHMIYGDIRKITDAKQALNGYVFDVVVDFLTYDCGQLKKTLDILEGKYSQYIFISSATVYHRTNYDKLISEETTAIGNEQWGYAYNKYLCEEELKRCFENRDEKYTIIRPGVTYGNTRVPYPIVPSNTQKEYSFLFRLKIGAPIPVFDHGETEVTLTHSRDFAKGVLGLMKNERAYSEAFHITTDETTTWGTVLEYLESIMGVRIDRLELTQKQIYDAIPYYKEVLLSDKGNKTKYDNSKILCVVPGLSFDTDLKEGLSEMVQFYETHCEFQSVDYRWMGLIDKLCADYSKRVVSLHITNKADLTDYRRGRYPMIDYAYRAMEKFRRNAKLKMI